MRWVQILPVHYPTGKLRQYGTTARACLPVRPDIAGEAYLQPPTYAARPSKAPTTVWPPLTCVFVEQTICLYVPLPPTQALTATPSTDGPRGEEVISPKKVHNPPSHAQPCTQTVHTLDNRAISCTTTQDHSTSGNYHYILRPLGHANCASKPHAPHTA
jgi:hypothetical protein